MLINPYLCASHIRDKVLTLVADCAVKSPDAQGSLKERRNKDCDTKKPVHSGIEKSRFKTEKA